MASPLRRRSPSPPDLGTAPASASWPPRPSQHHIRRCFVHWLARSDLVEQTLERLLTGVKQATPPRAAMPLPNASYTASSPGTPPGTPPRSPLPTSRAAANLASIASGSATKRAFRAGIKQFYFPGGAPLSPSTKVHQQSVIDHIFEHGNIATESCRRLTTSVCGLSSYCTTTLMQRLTERPGESVSKASFCSFWHSKMQTSDLATRLFRVLQSDVSRDYLTRADFFPLVHEVVERHPGLDFLTNSTQFQEKYEETVVARIFYTVNRSGNERISLAELKRSNLLCTLQMLDEEDDINEIFAYFSYEHFYVIYCKFWEIDDDHDFVLGRDDLAKYGNFALTPIVIDRIFEGCARPFLRGEKDKMHFEDFIVFLISEEDKSSDVSLDYWFRVCDLDSDGFLTVFELEAFYQAQNARIQTMSQEEVGLQDYVCQLMDIVKPAVEGRITRQDLKRSKLSRVFFNMLFNLEKFIQYESRDAQLIEQVRSTPEMSDWDRFACIEYSQYAEADSATAEREETDQEAAVARRDFDDDEEVASEADDMKD